MINTNTIDNHWIIRIGDGCNFSNSTPYKVWGGNLTNTDGKKNCHLLTFTNRVKPGDILWFITSNVKKIKGIIYACATFTSYNARINGPILDITPSNDEYGWSGITGDTEIHYTNLYTFHNIPSPTIHNIKGCNSYRNANTPSCSYLDLVTDYKYIKKMLHTVDKIDFVI
jgi:hypothetical protein